MDKKLEEMKKDLEQRVRISWIMIIFVSILIVCAVANILHPFIGGEDYVDFISGFQFGLLISLDLIAIYYNCKYRSDLKDEKKLKKLYLEENDEREKYIEQMAGKSSQKYACSLLIIAACIAGYFSVAAFVALMGAFAIEVIVSLSFYWYYSIKLTGNEE